MKLFMYKIHKIYKKHNYVLVVSNYIIIHLIAFAMLISSVYHYESQLFVEGFGFVEAVDI